MTSTRFAIPLLVLSCLPALPAGAQEEPVRLELVSRGQEGTAVPRLVLHVQQDAQDLSVRLTCGGIRASRAGAVAAGQSVVVELDVPPGAWTCMGTLSASFADGSAGDMPLAFEVVQHRPLQVSVDREHLDTAARHLEVRLDRPASVVEVTAYGEDGGPVGKGTVPVVGVAPGAPISVDWSHDRPGEVLRIHLRCQDVDGFWAGLDLFPWSYEIPHEDVVFETGQDVIRPSEAPKLSQALDEARRTLERYRLAEIPMSLYVGGYTDSVGDRASNQALSERRARAIARWFRENGFDRPVYHQGFGEDALAVATDDEVAEEQNRRAVYVLAAEAPSGGDFPRGNWTRLP